MDNLDAVFRAEIVGYTDEKITKTFDDLGIDSFDLINLRTEIETKLGRPIPDPVWMTFRSPADITRHIAPAASGAAAPPRGAHIERKYEIGMPQMAVSGLSESWLFKEIGDIHWSLISKGLNQPSSRILDGNGDRLYATFTRIRMSNTAPLVRYGENASLTIGGEISRYGSGIFLGNYRGVSGDNSFQVEVMSSFAKRSGNDTNKGLAKGQPDIPEGSNIAALDRKPAFVDEYRAARDGLDLPAIHECDYELSPYHDINGVGLLYFAAYPSIADVCDLRLLGSGNRWALQHSTTHRDIFYFANCDVEDTLHYSIVDVQETRESIRTTAVLRRKEGATPMALIKTTRGRLTS